MVAELLSPTAHRDTKVSPLDTGDAGRYTCIVRLLWRKTMPSVVPQIQFRDSAILEKLRNRGATTVNHTAREYLEQYFYLLQEEQMLYGLFNFTDAELGYICQALRFKELNVQTIPFMWAMLDDSRKIFKSEADGLDVDEIVRTVRNLSPLAKFALADYVRQSKSKAESKKK